jgi:hypothetical protein
MGEAVAAKPVREIFELYPPLIFLVRLFPPFTTDGGIGVGAAGGIVDGGVGVAGVVADE